MGMYTELFVEGTLKANAPTEVTDILRLLFDRETPSTEPYDLPDTPFFKCGRWQTIGSCSSYYHIPFAMSAVYTEIVEQRLCFISRSDLKNYDGEIEKFIDWITPYCERLRGWHWFEEHDQPTLFNVENPK